MRVLGIDGGIASIGWALLDVDSDTQTLSIIAAGVRTFSPPETAKERTPTNAVRRQHRGQRRVIRRRRQRMHEIRRLFHDAGLLPTAQTGALAHPGLNPWTLRADALIRPLDGPELAIALDHIARHRGFRSNAKRDAAANAADETSRMKKAIAVTKERLQGYRSVGQMFAIDPDFQDRKRNRGDFTRSVQRDDLEAETRLIFTEQRRLGSSLATEALQADFTRVAFFQCSLQDSEHLVRFCPFERDQKRTARRAYSFERFRLLSRLAALPMTADGQDVRLTPDQIAKLDVDFGATKSLTYKSLRRTLDLAPSVRFTGIADKDEKNDVVARHGSAAEGTYTLRAVLGSVSWHALAQHPAALDRVAEILTFRESPDSVRAGLIEAGISDPALTAIMQGVATGAFAQFTGAGHISAKAARMLLPSLAEGMVYSAACETVGYDPTARPSLDLDDVRNPVARKAVCEMVKQVRAIIAVHGQPDAIHVELARDIGKSAEERDRITKGIEDRNRQRDKTRARAGDLLGRRINADELLRFELWEEQNCCCLYSEEPISPEWIASGDNRVQVDHILPWSRFGDDSFMNKTLCMAKANQDKRGRTPFEWFQAEGRDWQAFASRVEGCRSMKGRKKAGFYLRKNAAEVETTFRNRNLGDTRYATRLLLNILDQTYSGEGKRQVLARPGQLTAKLRRAWGLDDLKKDANGQRLEDDRHHALDAIVVAATTESMLHHLTRAAQQAERQGLARGFDFSQVPPPAAGFRDIVRQVVGDVFVSRAENRRARGEAHAATIKRVETVDGKETVFERKLVEKLTLADLDTIPVPEPYGRIADPMKLRDGTVAELRRWIEAGRPKDALPRSPKGDVIRKVRVATKDKVAVKVRGGTADRGEMARVDVFCQPDRKGRPAYFLVPVYPHQIADRASFPRPPDRAVVAHVSEDEWTPVGGNHTFLFSLYGNSLIEVVKPDGEVIRGYFKGLDRSTGAVSIASHANPRKLQRGIGAKTLASFAKLYVDRLGNIHPVTRETRTCHGVACT